VVDPEVRLDKLEAHAKQLADDYRGMEKAMSDVDARLRVMEATSTVNQRANEQHQRSIDGALLRLDARVEEFKVDLKHVGDSVHTAMREVASALNLHMKEENETQKKILLWVLTTLATALSGVGMIMFTKVFSV
jgi:hypothetical protein